MAAGAKRKRAARATEPTFGEWEERLTRREKWLNEVLQMMMMGQWLSGVSDTVMARKWGCSPPNVRQIAAEANRVLRARLREDPAAKAEARAQLLQMFEVIRAKCMRNGDAQSLRVALDAMRAYGFYLGIEPTKRVEVTKRDDPFEGWSTAEKLAFSRDGRRPRRALRELANGNGANGDDHDGSDGLH